jgi:NAD(P)-dependent dehydrogenase (short-subunit alcohol dehydrogenase family)
VNALRRPGIEPIIGDVTQEEAARRAVALATDTFGRPEILVNNAGSSSTSASWT